MAKRAFEVDERDKELSEQSLAKNRDILREKSSQSARFLFSLVRKCCLADTWVRRYLPGYEILGGHLGPPLLCPVMEYLADTQVRGYLPDYGILGGHPGPPWSPLLARLWNTWRTPCFRQAGPGPPLLPGFTDSCPERVCESKDYRLPRLLRLHQFHRLPPLPLFPLFVPL